MTELSRRPKTFKSSVNGANAPNLRRIGALHQPAHLDRHPSVVVLLGLVIEDGSR